MLQTRIKRFIDSAREGINAGFITGMIIIFLILLGIPINLRNVALPSLILVMVLFGVRLARRLREESILHLLRNALAMGVVTGVLVLLLMSLINRWQERGIDVKEYFHAVTTETMTVLSGVPEDELFANPTRDLITGEYPEGAVLRTDPMRLTFDAATGLEVFDINLHIGGFYGFMIVLIIAGAVSAGITRALIEADVVSYWRRFSGKVSGSRAAHWGVLLIPLFLFALLWLTVGHGTFNATTGEYSTLNPILSLGGSAQELQLLIGFGIITFALVAMRATKPDDWGLDYQTRTAICLAVVLGMMALGIWRILGSKTYFIATPGALRGHATLSVLVAVIIGVLLAVQNVLALRTPKRFETQFAGSLALLIVVLMPLYLNQGQNDVMTIVGINVMLGLGLNIVVGYAGLLDLGYVAFFALGAYAYAFLSSNQLKLDKDNQPVGLKFGGNDEMVIKLAGWIVIAVVVTLVVTYVGLRLWRRRGAGEVATAGDRQPLVAFPSLPPTGITALITLVAVIVSATLASFLDNSGTFQAIFEHASPFLIGLIVGVIVAGLSGIALGIPVLRLRGDYLAIVTLGFGEIIRLLFTNLRDYTGGPQGILEIPRPLPSGATGGVNFLSMVYLVFLGAGLVAFFSTRLRASRTGRAWSAMKSDEDIAQSMGIHLVQSKLTAFAIGAAFAGIGGVLFAARQRNIYPNDFKLDVSIEVLSLVIIGGMGSIPGVIMGAIALIGVPEVLRQLETYRILVFGALLVAMVILRPEGLLPAPTAQLRERARMLVQRQKEGEA